MGFASPYVRNDAQDAPPWASVSLTVIPLSLGGARVSAVRPPTGAPGAATRWYQAANSVAAGRGCWPGPGAEARGQVPHAHRRTPRNREHRSRCHLAGNAPARSSSRLQPASFLRKFWTWASCLAARDPNFCSCLPAKVSSSDSWRTTTLHPEFRPVASRILVKPSRGKTSRLRLVGSLRAARIGRKQAGGRSPEPFPPVKKVGLPPDSSSQHALLPAPGWNREGWVPVAWASVCCRFLRPSPGVEMVVLVTDPNGSLPEIPCWGSATRAAVCRLLRLPKWRLWWLLQLLMWSIWSFPFLFHMGREILCCGQIRVLFFTPREWAVLVPTLCIPGDVACLWSHLCLPLLFVIERSGSNQSSYVALHTCTFFCNHSVKKNWYLQYRK